MTSWLTTPLERVPQLWAADAEALRALGIVTAVDLVETIHDNGLTDLSDSSGIPPDPLREYVSAAETLIARQKTHLWAFGIAALALIAIFLPTTMLVRQVQAEHSLAPAEVAYAELHREYTADPNQDKYALLREVNDELKSLADEDEASKVNLRLLSSALYDSIALDNLRSAGDDAYSANYIEQYEQHYKAYFKEARNQQDLIDENDPRIAFARVNAAQAWTNQAEILGTIDLEELSPDVAKFIAIELRDAHEQARLEASLARNTPGLSTDLFAQRIEDVGLKLDNQATRTLRRDTEQIERQVVDQVKLGLADIEAKWQTRIRELQATFNDQLDQMKRLQTSIIDEIGSEHVVTRNHLMARIGELETSRATENQNIAENLEEPQIDGTNCGWTEIEAAKAEDTLHKRCWPEEGMNDTVHFNISIENGVATVNEIRVNQTVRSDHPLRCDIEYVMNDVMPELFNDVGAHQCNLVFRPKNRRH